MRFSPISKLYAFAAAALLGLIVLALGSRHRAYLDFLHPVHDDLRNAISKTLFHVAGKPVRVLFLIKTLLFLLFLAALSRLAQWIVRRILRNNPRINEHRGYVLSRVLVLFIYTAGILIGLHVEHVSLNTLAFIGGTLGVGVGFGLQALVGNFVAGLILLVEQPIRLGDRIEFGDRTGEVVRVGSRASWIRTYENAILIVPNSDFTTKQILNWTASDPKVRIAIPVSVAQGTDPKAVIQHLRELASLHADIMEDPAPDVILSDLGTYSITFILRAWTLNKANDFARLRSDLYLEILTRFAEAEIQIPYTQLDLHIKSIETPISIATLHSGAL